MGWAQLVLEVLCGTEPAAATFQGPLSRYLVSRVEPETMLPPGPGVDQFPLPWGRGAPLLTPSVLPGPVVEMPPDCLLFLTPPSLLYHSPNMHPPVRAAERPGILLELWFLIEHLLVLTMD